MLYRLCNNGKGVLMTREICQPGKYLVIDLDGVTDGHTAVVKSADRVFYRPIKEGKCDLELGKLSPGPIEITILKDDEVKPSWILDELYLLRSGDIYCILGNTLEYDRLLADQRVEIDDMRRQMQLFKNEVEQFRQDFDEVYAGTEVI